MKPKCEVIDSGVITAETVMLKDSELLHKLNADSPIILHFYEWAKPSLTYGYFIKPAMHLNIEIAEFHGVQMARRPTGGGIIFHLTDFAFSVLAPMSHPNVSHHTLLNYAWINTWVAHVIAQFNHKLIAPILRQELHHSSLPFCMMQPTPYDIMIDNQKVGGAAQRNIRNGLLHQSSICLTTPDFGFLNKIIINQQIVSSMQQWSYCLLPGAVTSHMLHIARMHFKQLLINFFNYNLSTTQNYSNN